MIESFEKESIYLLNIILSVILGFSIGLERKLRSKGAGIRTHTIVCLGSCLLMIISKYGFENNADKARIAAQIVSGIGFIGAGMIVFKKDTIHGLTTAAGIWTTAAIGMACGAEMYVLAVGTTVILIAVQCILHIDCKIFKIKKTFELKISFIQKIDENEKVKEIFQVKHFHKVIIKKENNFLQYVVTLYTNDEVKSEQLDEIMQQNKFITSIERCVEE